MLIILSAKVQKEGRKSLQ